MGGKIALMKIVITIARLLLGLIFLIVGLNGFLNFIHAPLPTGAAATFLGVLFSSHYIVLVAGAQVIAGILLLIDQYVPLALVLLAAEIANILTYHATMDPGGFPLAIIVAILWIVVASRYRAHFALLFARKVPV
jgi:putative oxidoreductase